MTDTLDIKAKAPYPAGMLSNFAPHAFLFDGVRCASMEGFVQSLKIEDEVEQANVCNLVGAAAQALAENTTGALAGRCGGEGSLATGFPRNISYCSTELTLRCLNRRRSFEMP